MALKWRLRSAVRVRKNAMSLFLRRSIAFNCPFCKSQFRKEEKVIDCPKCGAPHHTDCWNQQNFNCAVFGCDGSIRKFSIKDGPPSRVRIISFWDKWKVLIVCSFVTVVGHLLMGAADRGLIPAAGTILFAMGFTTGVSWLLSSLFGE